MKHEFPELLTLEEYGFETRRNVLPKGTTDVMMSRLFPEQRSAVPIDEERRLAVYVILKNAEVVK